jgi:hypothetical protein
MRRAILLPAALLALSAACHDASAPPPAPEGRPPVPPPVAASPTISASASLAIRDPAGAAGPFRIADLTRLDVSVSYTALEPGPHATRLDVLAPGGALYAQLPASIDVGPDGSAASSHRLEVQGTPIETFRQLGRWRFALSVDGAPLASADVDLGD